MPQPDAFFLSARRIRALPVTALRAAAIAGCLAMLPAPAPGRVFTRSKDGGMGGVSAESLGWKTAYRTRINLNGGEGDVDLLAIGQPLEYALISLEQAYRNRGFDVRTLQGRSMTWGVAADEETIVRFFAFHLDPPPQALLLRMAQTREAFAASMRPPERSLLDELPEYPQSRPTLYTADLGSRMAVEHAASHAPPAEVALFFESELLDRGWRSATPSDPVQPSPPGIGLYTRGRELCVVHVNSTGQDGQTMITLIHKRLSLAPAR